MRSNNGTGAGILGKVLLSLHRTVTLHRPQHGENLSDVVYPKKYRLRKQNELIHVQPYNQPRVKAKHISLSKWSPLELVFCSLQLKQPQLTQSPYNFCRAWSMAHLQVEFPTIHFSSLQEGSTSPLLDIWFTNHALVEERVYFPGPWHQAWSYNLFGPMRGEKSNTGTKQEL